MLREAMLKSSADSRNSFRCCLFRIRPSTPCCISFLVSLSIFLLVTNLMHFSVVSMVQHTPGPNVPAIVSWDQNFASKISRKSLSEEAQHYDQKENEKIKTSTTTKQQKEKEKNEKQSSSIHFEDNLPLDDATIRLQANLTLAKLMTKTVITSQNMTPSKEEPSPSMLHSTTKRQVGKPTEKPPTASDILKMKTISRMNIYHNRYVKNPKYKSYYNESFKSDLPIPKKAVFLLTNYRSGSTFLGQIFNQHPDVFYTFEPLFVFKDKIQNQFPLQLDVIRRNLQCSMTSTMDQYQQMTWNPQKTGVWTECLMNNMCFRLKTKGLCSGDFCTTKDRRHSCTACGPLDIEKVNHFCRQHKMTATKVIRVSDLMKLKPLFEDPNMDLKVIHLIRDPRGIANSRLKIHKKWESIHMTSTCDRLLKNAVLGQSENTPHWLEGKYMRVRYEDLAQNPTQVTSSIYKFVDLPFVNSMKEWIKINTNNPSPASSSGKTSPYSTNRNSKATSERWRKELSWKQVEELQNKLCDRKTFDYFGYEPILREQDMNKTSSAPPSAG